MSVAASTSPASAPLQVINPPPASPFTPIAVRLPVKSRATAIKLIGDLKPAGNPDPVVLEIARNTALALIEKKFPAATGIETVIETNAAAAAQIMVIVTPHEL